MKANRKVVLTTPRGKVEVDVLAEENVHGITHRIICECKDWRKNVSQEVVHAFRIVVIETGANRGYIISRVGFQSGAPEAAKKTNIELVTFAEFQNIYFDKWISNRIWAIELELKGFHSYYEPIGRPGYGLLKNDRERAAYDAVWEKYQFAGLMLQPFSPYLRMMGHPHPFPPLPFDVSELNRRGIGVPDDIKAATGYREFFEILTGYATAALKELRRVNPVIRDKAPEAK